MELHSRFNLKHDELFAKKALVFGGQWREGFNRRVGTPIKILSYINEIRLLRYELRMLMDDRND
jgi:hypothetical protein